MCNEFMIYPTMGEVGVHKQFQLHSGGVITHLNALCLLLNSTQLTDKRKNDELTGGASSLCICYQ